MKVLPFLFSTSMLSRFKNYIASILSIGENDKFLLAVSGGIDSVCMAYLFKEAGFDFAIAHCNFGLRAEESDGDEQLVKELAERMEVPFHVMHFNTIEYAQLQKVGIQVAARELRYNWFENIRRKYAYDYVAIAHNADDAIETFFINLIRGCGIQGITGIKARNENIVRPLLFAHRSEIEEYCKQNDITYRTDSSNCSDKYLRNRLRNNILPQFEKESSDFKKSMHENLERFSEAAELYNYAIAHIISEVFDKTNEKKMLISIEKLMLSPAPQTVLYEILKPYGFNSKTCDDVFASLNGISGKTFLSLNYRLIKDRNNLIINELTSSLDQKFYIDSDTLEIATPLQMAFSFHESESYMISKDKQIADFDADRLVFPLMLRRWQHGDYFHPLGMKGMKKVSDFFTDSKLSIVDKENCWILTSADEIVWLIGWRIDDRFKIRTETKNILKVEIKY